MILDASGTFVKPQNVGHKYYLVIYTEEKTKEIIKKQFSVAVGSSRMQSGILDYAKGSNYISVNSSRYSSNGIINVGDRDT